MSDLRELTKAQAAYELGVSIKTFNAQLEAGRWDGCYLLHGEVKKFPVHLIRERQREFALVAIKSPYAVKRRATLNTKATLS